MSMIPIIVAVLVIVVGGMWLLNKNKKKEQKGGYENTTPKVTTKAQGAVMPKTEGHAQKNKPNKPLPPQIGIGDKLSFATARVGDIYTHTVRWDEM